jgi:hypothetical protein
MKLKTCITIITNKAKIIYYFKTIKTCNAVILENITSNMYVITIQKTNIKTYLTNLLFAKFSFNDFLLVKD